MTNEKPLPATGPAGCRCASREQDDFAGMPARLAPGGDLYEQAVRRQQARRDREAEITRLVFEPLPPPPVYGLRRLWLAWRERRERGRARG
ncbi:hypothetical protein [Cellulomonas sp. NPDC058312]|uniref:hypothetical protein n=1 Tax=Cellulomonas sp. NPDC058312 TaxID=3346441 RepID=UPI0036ED1512